MRLSPESKSVLDKLLGGGEIAAQNVSVGPLDKTTRLLLWIIIDNYEQLSNAHGAGQAEALLDAYLTQLRLDAHQAVNNSEPSNRENPEDLNKDV